MKKTNLFTMLLISFLTLCSSNPIFATKNEDYHELLNFEQKLEISRPSSAISVESDTYYITGTCNPDEPLLINNETIENTQSGIWGINVNLLSGENKFTFKQDDIEKIVTIFKDLPVSTTKKINNPTEKSFCTPPFPTKNIVTTEQTLKLFCYAPKDSSVTAYLDENKFELEPENSSSSENDEYIKFTCEANFEDEKYQTDYYNVGTVKYIISKNDEQTEIYSDGCIIFSENEELSTQYIEVSKARASIFLKPDINSPSFTSIKQGCVLETDQNYVSDDWFKLKDNLGYILKSSVCPASPESDTNNTISDIQFITENKREKLILSGTCKPMFAPIYSPKKLMVRLYYTTGIQANDVDVSNSKLIESININQQKAQADIEFNLNNENSLLGYNIEYEENHTVITLKSLPKTSKNLKGINVMLNAGHGGFDSGAPGLLGKVSGPSEKDFSLAYTLALKEKLEALGANVILTRKDDTNISLNNIAILTEEQQPDIFLSIHGDSVDDNINPNKISGFTVYYGNQISKHLAQTINEKMSENIKNSFAKNKNSDEDEDEEKDDSHQIIPSRGAKYNEYYVTKSTITPSVLFEIGMLTNPSDTRALTSQDYINDWSENLAYAINQYFTANNND